MKKITYLNKKSLANLLGIFGIFYGVIAGVLFGVLGGFGGIALGQNSMLSLGLASIIISPILYGTLGYLSGYFGASIYNKLAEKGFGIEIELE